MGAGAEQRPGFFLELGSWSGLLTSTVRKKYGQAPVGRQLRVCLFLSQRYLLSAREETGGKLRITSLVRLSKRVPAHCGRAGENKTWGGDDSGATCRLNVQGATRQVSFSVLTESNSLGLLTRTVSQAQLSGQVRL